MDRFAEYVSGIEVCCDGVSVAGRQLQGPDPVGKPPPHSKFTSVPIKFRSLWATGDLGRIWRPHETHRNTLIEPNRNGSLLRFDYEKDGKPKQVLLFANPHSQTGRDHRSIHVSFDEGRSWPEEYRLLLDEGRGNGYPSMTRTDDSHVGIVYEGSQAHLVFEKLSLNELLKLAE